MENKTKERYSLFTAITMIVGICIGSGIFFKADNVLIATGGSVFLGIILFILGAVAIIFGGLSVAELASRNNKPGGLITYSEEFISKRYGIALGWFHMLVYYPTLTFVVSFVVGIYLSTLFGWSIGLLGYCLIGAAVTSVCFLYNILFPKFGGLFQDTSCIIKVIPLVILGVCGMVWGNPAEGVTHLSAQLHGSGKWIMGINAVVFAYDGWIISTSISHEIKNSRKNLPLALAIAPLVVLAIYLVYFVSISTYLGSTAVLELGDNAVYKMASDFLGGFFSKLVLVCIVISVMGTVNGVVMGSIRLPYGLALRGSAVPCSQWLARVNKNAMPVNSGIFMYVVTMVWGVIHYITTKTGFLGNSDVSEIAICACYILYLPFYYRVFKLWKDGEIKSFFRGVICPIFATVGVGLIVYGSLIGGWIYVLYLGISAAIVIAGWAYYSRKGKKRVLSE